MVEQDKIAQTNNFGGEYAPQLEKSKKKPYSLSVFLINIVLVIILLHILVVASAISYIVYATTIVGIISIVVICSYLLLKFYSLSVLFQSIAITIVSVGFFGYWLIFLMFGGYPQGILSFFVNTEYNFVYMSCPKSRGDYLFQAKKAVCNYEKYSINNNQLASDSSESDVEIYLYDSKTKINTKLSLEEAQKLYISNSLISPDEARLDSGFVKAKNTNNIGNKPYLTKGVFQRQIQLTTAASVDWTSRGEAYLLGWVDSSK